ncbi:MAG: cytochrome c family protein [Thalassobaculales bacterium]
MDSFELNKIAGAVLMAGILVMASGMIAEGLVHPKTPAQPGYAVAKPEGTQTAAAPAAAEALEPVGALLASADIEAGKNVARRCTACHTFEKGGPNRVGPNLWNVVGHTRAHADGFAYSPTLAGQKGQNWDYEALNAFLHNPKAVVPGTKMAFAGLAKTKDRADLIAYLRSLSDSPQPLP